MESMNVFVESHISYTFNMQMLKLSPTSCLKNKFVHILISEVHELHYASGVIFLSLQRTEN